MSTEADWMEVLLYDFMYPDRIQTTEIQRQIERNVTNGLGYNSRTVFVDEYPRGIRSVPNYSGIDITDEAVRSTLLGLRTHLLHLDAIVSGNLRLHEAVGLLKQIAIDGVKDRIFAEQFKTKNYAPPIR